MFEQLQQIASAMAGKTPSPLDGVDPTGRLDVLISGVIERAASQVNPEIRTLYPAIKPAVDSVLLGLFGGAR